ncbi:MAG: hypothetical protein Q7T89_01490 [Anaerolineales bacterium]|nr:hypothetical protein [Anaerolineales bacterium]
MEACNEEKAELASTVGDDYLFWRVSTGKEGASMVGWKGILTDEHIWQVVSFVRTLKQAIFQLKKK